MNLEIMDQNIIFRIWPTSRVSDQQGHHRDHQQKGAWRLRSRLPRRRRRLPLARFAQDGQPGDQHGRRSGRRSRHGRRRSAGLQDNAREQEQPVEQEHVQPEDARGLHHSRADCQHVAIRQWPARQSAHVAPRGSAAAAAAAIRCAHAGHGWEWRQRQQWRC